MKILVINGPNLNMLGKREPGIYGVKTLDDINADLVKKFEGRVTLEFYQSNCEGDIVTALHESTADAEYVPYVRPQEHGNHTDSKILDVHGSLAFEAEDMEISVLHHSTDVLHRATHTDELVKSDGTHVRVDYKVSGISSNSCGPELSEKYRLCEEDIHFKFMIKV